MSLFRREKTISNKGIQSEVEIGEFNGRRAIKKVSGRGLPDWELEELRYAQSSYRKKLRSVGLSVPDNLTTNVNGGLETVDVFVKGEDVDTQIRQGRGSRSVRRITGKLCSLKGKDVYIDAKPANWIDGEDGLVFVDTFPPPLSGNDGHITPWKPDVYKRPRELFEYTYGNLRGQKTKLLASARFTYPERLPEMEKAVLTEMKEGASADDYEYVKDQVERGYPEMDELYS